MASREYQPRKLFTLEEASRTLPLVSRVVRDIVETSQSIFDARREAARLTQSGDTQGASHKRAQVDRFVIDVQEYLEELDTIGCLIKDYQRGLIDFPSRHEGRTVFLCWELGEPDILHWHELDAGYAGREPIERLFSNSEF